MLLGQYSTGKTTFIKHLLKTSYPGLSYTDDFSFSLGHNALFFLLLHLILTLPDPLQLQELM
jgi:septin family protein